MHGTATSSLPSDRQPLTETGVVGKEAAVDEAAMDEATGASSDPDRFDVVVIGGAFTGASFGLLLRRRLPECRIAIVELAERHGHRVGEATVEVSACFMTRILGMYEHLSRHHQPKHGLRYWLSDRPDCSLAEMTEVGGHELPHLPSFQLDRPVLDEEILRRARDAGCTILRPAKVRQVDHGWPTSTIRVELGAQDGGAPPATRELKTRWVVDASGRRAFLARRRRLLEKVEEHPTAAAWGWWQGVVDIDQAVTQKRQGGRKQPAAGPGLEHLPMSRRLATNHFCGYGYWIWMIPQTDGKTSIGLVYDKRHFQLPGQGALRQRFEDFIRSHPGLGELVAPAELAGESFGAYQHLPYRSRQYMDRGWALLGDAAAFLDPYYSPGLDHAAISIVATLDVVVDDLEGRFDETPEAPSGSAKGSLDQRIRRHNGDFARSYPRWLEALYLDKYELLGDAELVACAFLFDTAMYHLGVVTPVYLDPTALANPLFGPDSRSSGLAYRIMAAFNRRLVGLARFRRRVGTYGRLNTGHSIASRTFGLGAGSIRPLLFALRLWLRLEGQRLSQPLRRLLGRAPSPPAPGDLATGEPRQPAIPH